MRLNFFKPAAAFFSAATIASVFTGTVNAQSQNTPQPKVEREVHADWTVECVTTTQNGQSRRGCYMVQVHRMSKTNQTVFQVIVQKSPKGNSHTAVALAPLGVLLTKGLVVTVKGENPAGYGFHNCGQRGCVAQFALNEKMIGAFKAGAKAGFRVVDSGSGKPVVFDVSLSGFSAALKRIGELTPGS